ncbi:MAG: amino acid permease [Tannerella sp.]|jgi:amino acid transporter|nr:amino acid permease [Tannerella sp.]
MTQDKFTTHQKSLGTSAVFFTSISTVLGAVLFLRFGMAVGNVGLLGTLLIVIMGHMITIPTALAISEIATNRQVEGGGEYYIISRSFGLKIGSTIGVALFFSQAISIAFYIIAFTEAFTPFFNWWSDYFGYELPRQAISIPSLVFLGAVVIIRGVGTGMKMLYAVCFLLFASLFFFFIGKPIAADGEMTSYFTQNFGFFNHDKLFVIFAICFPAFTGMTAGVGLSGDLKSPGKSIPIGTIGGTVVGLLVYILVIWKLSVSASQADLVSDQLIMSRIALFGNIIIPMGLAAATFSSALGSILVAPRTLQAIARDESFPMKRFNQFFAKGKGEKAEPVNASLVSFVIALIFVSTGSIDMVAEVISMFFLISYGTLCLISFLNHFGSSPSYRPRFKSKWYISLAGFILSVWVMFMINPVYTLVAYTVIVILYLIIEHSNKNQKGLVDIISGALFQINRRIRVFMQKQQSAVEEKEWRPSVICISPNSFERDKVLDLMKWIGYQHGFGTYFHFIEGYYNKQTHAEAQEIQAKLITRQKDNESSLYIDTMISPSYTSAIAQVIQTPSISGMDNNMILFEYAKSNPKELERILDNIELVKAGNFDVCIYAGSNYPLRTRNGIHVWTGEAEDENISLMILLGYIILSHPDWSKSAIRIFVTTTNEQTDLLKKKLEELIEAGRMPITMANVEIVIIREGESLKDIVTLQSREAGLTIIGFHDKDIRHKSEKFFTSFDGIGDVLFVNASQIKDIN